jgi:Spy/CpxP family protein refolding chaperone
LRISLLMFVVAIIFTLNASAMLGSKSPYKWWKDPQIAEELNLTKDQAKSIEKIFSSYKKRISKYRKQLKNSEVELKKELQNPEAKKEDVLQLIDEIENTKAAYTRTKVEMFLRVKDVLTPDQAATLHKIKHKFRPYHR